MTDLTTADLDRAARLTAFLEAPHLARLATVAPETLQPHVVPVWFLWDGASVWISSYSSTRKVRELRQNPNCAVVIDVPPNADQLAGVLFEGAAELLTEPALVQAMATRIYTRYLGPEGVLAAEPQEWIHAPENLLIKLTPARTMLW